MISKHISYYEATKSITARRNGLDNDPQEEFLLNMQFLANTIFEPLRKALGEKPIGIASFYRSIKLNKLIGGSAKSQHCEGEAMDIDADIFNNGITNKQIFDWIKNNTNFDQLIWEFGTKDEPEWVHVSKTLNENRGEILIAYKKNGKTKYKYYK